MKTYTLLITSRSVLPKMKNVSHKVVEKIKIHILYSITFFFENRAIYDNVEKQPDRPQMTIWRMRIA